MRSAPLPQTIAQTQESPRTEDQAAEKAPAYSLQEELVGDVPKPKTVNNRE